MDFLKPKKRDFVTQELKWILVKRVNVTLDKWKWSQVLPSCNSMIEKKIQCELVEKVLFQTENAPWCRNKTDQLLKEAESASSSYSLTTWDRKKIVICELGLSGVFIKLQNWKFIFTDCYKEDDVQQYSESPLVPRSTLSSTFKLVQLLFMNQLWGRSVFVVC